MKNYTDTPPASTFATDTPPAHVDCGCAQTRRTSEEVLRQVVAMRESMTVRLADGVERPVVANTAGIWGR